MIKISPHFGDRSDVKPRHYNTAHIFDAHRDVNGWDVFAN